MDRKDFELDELRRAIAAQSNAFDQIDTKVAAALGFAFVAIFQIMAGILRADSRIFHRTCALTCLNWFFFGILILSFVVAIAFGIACRWPSGFSHSADLTDAPQDIDALKDHLISATQAGYEDNETVLGRKANFGRWTNIAVSVAILSSLGLCTTLFVSIAAF